MPKNFYSTLNNVADSTFKDEAMKLGALEICKATRDKIAQRLHLVKTALCFCPIQQLVCVFVSTVDINKTSFLCGGGSVLVICIIKFILTLVTASPSLDLSFLMVFLYFSKRQQFHKALSRLCS